MSTLAQISLPPGSDMLTVRVPYDADFTDDIKRTIIWHGRRWDKAAKVWKVHKYFARDVRDLCIKYFARVSLDKNVEALLARIDVDDDFVHEEG
jgi:hypothetical protein